MLSLRTRLLNKVGLLSDLTVASDASAQALVNQKFGELRRDVEGMHEIEGIILTGENPWEFKINAGTCVGGKYVVTEKLGKDNVWKARQTLFTAGRNELHHDVVIKFTILKKEMAPEQVAMLIGREELAIEAIGVATNCSPYSLELIDAGHLATPDGKIVVLWQAFECMKGDVKHLFRQLPEEAKPFLVMRLVAQIAEVLAVYHAKGIIHRDIKPDNVLLDAPDEEWLSLIFANFKLADTGLVKTEHNDMHLTQAGTTLGTVYYMSPEQARGKPTDRSDVWSLGIMLYELVTGELPHDFANTPRGSSHKIGAQTIISCLTTIIETDPKRLADADLEKRQQYPPWFITLVDRMLQRDESLRPTSFEIRMATHMEDMRVRTDFFRPPPCTFMTNTVAFPLTT